jgi:16S rRNA (uracil1498-N3)-methyltransferase
MSLRLYTPAPLQEGLEFDLPEDAARHAQVRRVQPGDALCLFNGEGADWAAVVLAMGRRDVRVRVGAPSAVARELPFSFTIALGMPANDRMDTVVEKATELGATALQPLVCERSVLRLAGERAERKQAHWQGVAVAACEQSGRAVLPQVAPVRTLADWLRGLPPRAEGEQRWLLSPAAGVRPLAEVAAPTLGAVCTLSGPEGGLSPAEEALALAAGFQAVGLGPRVLRADTAPLAALAWAGLR